MALHNKLTPEMIKRAQALRVQGLTQKVIGLRLGISEGCVQKALTARPAAEQETKEK